MIVVRAPLRLSFIGGGTDLLNFSRKTPGRVISSAIDKYVYIVINRTPLIDKVSARYAVSETVNHPSELQHTRIKAALLDMGIESGIEIASFASVPAKTGLGSSSSFSVALMHGLHAYLDKKLTKHELAEHAARLEIKILKEPIGKQDQFAAALGGFNVLQFNTDESVTVEPVSLDYRKRLELEDSLLLFYMGITRDASSVLTKVSENVDDNFETMGKMADSVYEFRDKLLGGDIEGLGSMLHEGWLRKRSLSSNTSSDVIDKLYDAGMKAGAWGGKVPGAGGGGCIMFLGPPSLKEEIRKAVISAAEEAGLTDFTEIPVGFVQSGTEVLFNGDSYFDGIVTK